MEFKDMLLQVRAQLNLSQQALGEKLHVSLATINRWESGKVQPTKKAKCAFEQLCKSEGITFDRG